MRRLTLVLAATLVLPACRPRDKIRVEPTEESLNLKSEVRMSDPDAARQLIRGFHNLEHNSWRWTAGKFSVTLQPPPNATTTGAVVQLNATLAEAVASKTGGVTLTALLNGRQLGSSTWTAPGEQVFRAEIPASALGPDPVTVDFALDKYLPAGSVDARELGLIVSSVALQSR